MNRELEMMTVIKRDNKIDILILDLWLKKKENFLMMSNLELISLII
jgi:hypothetical protein